jgi:tetratricopeptide (TPR) repeat protein
VSRSAWVVVQICASAALLFASTARAQTDPPNVIEARQHLERGDELLRQENYDAALAEFERAYQLVGDHPFRHLILFNIARAHELRFRYDLALEYYQRYLDEGGPQAERRAEVQATMRTLEGLLATIDVQSNVAAEVWVDDRLVGNAPGNVRVPGGRHTVELRASGYAESRQEIQIASRETQTMSFTLSELAGEYRGLDPLFFFGATALAIGSALAGGGVGIAAIVRRGDVDAQLMDPVRRWDGSSLMDARREIETYQLTADVLFGIAGAFGIAAVVLAFLTDFEGSGSESASVPRVLPWASSNGAGLAIEGSF